MTDQIPTRPKTSTDETSVGSEPDQSQQQPTEEQMKKAGEAFSRFQSLQIDPKATVGARQIITSCVVRRPKNNEFIRVFCDVEPFTGLVYEDKDDDAYYLVTPAALQYFYAPPPTKMLVLTVNQNGSFFLWPVPTDDRNTWNDSARKAYQLAKTDWVKLVGDPAPRFTTPIWRRVNCRRPARRIEAIGSWSILPFQAAKLSIALSMPWCTKSAPGSHADDLPARRAVVC